jgi:hypothetical protein
MITKEEAMNFFSISLRLWQTAMLRSTVWFLEASRVSLHHASFGLQKPPSGMRFAESHRSDRATPLAGDPWASAMASEAETQTRVLH